ncbi:hypothetical protein [Chitinimonas sp. BJYL2]|uniref:hypothetical protein n=1 Tax=Chitinimonas sp. BJYL2 TaxID=2976696 RepID=UPI0022B4115B|nr:hypothetical protein [Chitinimonas sp. BJYL2]
MDNTGSVFKLAYAGYIIGALVVLIALWEFIAGIYPRPVTFYCGSSGLSVIWDGKKPKIEAEYQGKRYFGSIPEKGHISWNAYNTGPTPNILPLKVTTIAGGIVEILSVGPMDTPTSLCTIDPEKLKPAK